MTSFMESTESFEGDLVRSLGILEVSSLGGWSTLDFEEIHLVDDLSELSTHMHILQVGVGSARLNNNKK